MVNVDKRARIDYIDVFRSFGILLMVMGHIGYGEKFNFFIHAFHMPMFFWISGYLFQHKTKEEMSFFDLLRKKAKSLLLPYLVFGLAHYIFYVIVKHGNTDLSPLIHLFSINTTDLPICGALWFLTALFFTDIIFYLIDRYISKEIMVMMIVGIIAVFGNVAAVVLPFTLPFALGVSFVGVGLYYLGFLFKKYHANQYIHYLMNLSWIPNIILSVITAILIFANGYINMREGTYANLPLFWINAILAIVVGINFARLIYPLIKNNFIGSWLRGIGKDSIVYLCLNQVVILVVTKCINIAGLPIVASKIIVSVITLFLLFIASQLLTKTKLRIFIGKW